jgi:ribosomal subunit interface protein
MDIPLQITWRDMPPSPAIEAEIRERVAKLAQFHDHIVSCRVVVESPHEHHRKGKFYQITIDLKVPGKEIVVSREPGQNHAHEDFYVALRDAFDAARRQLQDHSRVIKGVVKEHGEHHAARVYKRFLGQGFGYLRTHDGREVYFDRAALQNADFESLDEGTEVWYVEELGAKGAQAKRISVGKHHPPEI